MSTPETVIIADRDTLITSALRVEFSLRDFIVLLASSAEEAEDFAESTVASLVVLDVGSLRLAGYDACVRIRRREGYSACPIVLTTPQASAPVKLAAERAGATCVVPKDYSFADLIKAVLPHVAKSHPLVKNPARWPGVGERAQTEWRTGASFAWQFGSESRLSHNAKLMPVVRAAGSRVPLVKAT